MNPIELSAADKKIQEAALVREWCQHEGFKIIKAKFEDKIKKSVDLMLDMNTSEERIKELRQKVHVWTEVMNMLKGILLTGELNARIMRDENLEVSLTNSEQGEQNGR